jgi:hypothetical protein
MLISNNANFDKKIDYFVFIVAVVYYLFIQTIPFFEQITSPYLSMIVIILLFTVIVLSNPNKYITLLIPLSSVMILEIFYKFIYELSSVPMYVYGRIIWLLPAMLSYFVLTNNNNRTIKLMVNITIGALILTSITSIVGISNDPMAARNAASISDSKSAYAVYLNMKNIGGFKIVYMLVAIYPMVVCLYKYKKISTLLFLIVTSVFGWNIFISQYTTALIFFVAAILSLLYNKKFKIKKLFTSGILLMIFVLLLKSFIAELFYFVSNNIDSVVLSYRFRYLADIFLGVDVGNNEAQARTELYQLSINSIIKHPVIGFWLYEDGSKASGHSFILDTIAKYGLVGLGALIIYYKQIIKKFYIPFINEPFIGYMFYSLIISIFLGIVNPIDYLLTTAFIVPLFGYIIKGNSGKI